MVSAAAIQARVPAPRRPPRAGGWRLRLRAATGLLLAVLLPACAAKPRRDTAVWAPVQGVVPAAAPAFRVAGRLAVSDGHDGGSAGFVWIQRGECFEFELRQPVSQKTWRLRGDARSAVLEGGDGGPRRAASAEELLLQMLGWHVPVAALRDWVRGLPHAGGGPVQVERDDSGRVRSLRQDGWRVDYTAWLDGGDWPTRIRARQEPYSVRLNIQDWAVARD